MIVRRLALLPEVICASPSYLHAEGTPRHPNDLQAHRAVGFFSSTHTFSYPFELVVDGQLRQYALARWLTVDDAENYVASAASGCGLIQLPRFHVESELREGRLVEVLAGWKSPGLPVSALYPRHRQLSPRVRVFVDWVVDLYRERFDGVPSA